MHFGWGQPRICFTSFFALDVVCRICLLRRLFWQVWLNYIDVAVSITSIVELSVTVPLLHGSYSLNSLQRVIWRIMYGCSRDIKGDTRSLDCCSGGQCLEELCTELEKTTNHHLRSKSLLYACLLHLFLVLRFLAHKGTTVMRNLK